MSIEIIEANLERREHAQDVLTLTSAYACDAMGGGVPLAPEILDHLIAGLRAHPTTRIFLLYQHGVAVGIATCFLGFSTFHARPLLNIHDFAFLPEARSKGLGLKLLQAVEAKARELGCCKVTLEVQENNRLARRLYERVGLMQAACGDANGGLLSYSKVL